MIADGKNIIINVLENWVAKDSIRAGGITQAVSIVKITCGISV